MEGRYSTWRQAARGQKFLADGSDPRSCDFHVCRLCVASCIPYAAEGLQAAMFPKIRKFAQGRANATAARKGVGSRGRIPIAAFALPRDSIREAYAVDRAS